MRLYSHKPFFLLVCSNYETPLYRPTLQSTTTKDDLTTYS